MKQQSTSTKGLRFADILITVMIALVFGVIFKMWDSVYSLAKPLFPQAGQLTYGMWFMAGPVAFLLVRKPGVALLASLAAANVSALLGSTWGQETIIYGLVQGLAAEIVFAIFGYRKHSLIVAGVAGILSAVGSFIVDLGFGYANYETWVLVLKYGLRVVSAFVFAGIFAYLIVRAVEATGVTKLIRPISKEDIASLDR
ncbi:ECF transporter S component [Paenibacillus sp. N1-5-1-14]|uniref:ECF transporter S component n=1 Tax=Paenibacillus radicibacter TaxID=2972488 RepID=UPI002159A29D|nr:ECF transporter S component [Paenibacillus radicibacter]MCR8644658.1 ECF transporter S component [Paenibacillus radicibacter]